MDRLSNIEVKNPEIMSDEFMGDLLAGFGNHEGKSLLLLSMQPGIFYGKSDLHRLIKNLPGADQVYSGDLSNQMAYCRYSLDPIGVVAKADFGETLKFGITELGEKIGKPLAASLIDFANRNEIALETIFGGTKSTNPKLRSPYVRMRLMENILTAPSSIQLKDIEEASGLSQGLLTKHMIDLAASDLIDYKPWSFDKDEVSYRIGPTLYIPGNIGKKPSAYLLKALNYLEATGEATLDELARHCSDSFGDEDITLSEKRTRLTSALHGLSKADSRYIEIINRRRTTADSTEAAGDFILNKNQRAFWEELLNIVEKVRTGDKAFLDYWSSESAKLLNDPETVALSLSRSNEKSSYMQDGTNKDIEQLVMGALVNASAPLSYREIREIIVEGKKRTLSIFGISAILRGLSVQGKVTRHKSKITRYSLN